MLSTKKTANSKAISKALLLLVLVLAGCNSATQSVPDTHSSNVELGIPRDGDPSDDNIKTRSQYTMSYNCTYGYANWVSWNENASRYGSAARSPNFNTDSSLSGSCVKIKESDYPSGTGYDRGHICPSECRTSSDSDNYATFYMSNIFPQCSTLNRYTWYSLEDSCKNMCLKSNKELYVIAGGLYKTKQTLNNEGKVYVPDSCWKIVVVMNKGEGLSKASSSTRVIAVMMANRQYNTAENDWWRYKTTVRNIEQQTGYNFLDLIPKSLQDVIETKIDE